MNYPVPPRARVSSTYVAEDRPSLGEEALGLVKIICPSRGNARARKQEWVGWGAE